MIEIGRSRARLPGSLFVVACALLAAGPAASPSTKRASAAQRGFLVELTGQSTTTWKAVGKPPHGGCSNPKGSTDWIVPTKGNGTLAYTYSGSGTGSFIAFPGGGAAFSGGANVPASGSIVGTFAAYVASQGYFSPSGICEDHADFFRAGGDEIAPTSNCGPFTARFRFGLQWDGGAARASGALERASREFGEGCPFLQSWPSISLGSKINPFNFFDAKLSLSKEELLSGHKISRSWSTTETDQPPDRYGLLQAVTKTSFRVTLQPVGADDLIAVAHVSSAVRGGTATLDGSASRGRITSYAWTFRAADCGNAATKAGARKTGEKVTIKVLCPVAAKLTVSNGRKTNSATVTVPVTPREFKTPPVKHRELLKDDRVSDPPFVHPGSDYGIKLGLNVAACDEKSTGRPLLCPPPRTVGGTVTGLGGRYTFARVDDRGGPFDGFFYVATAPMTIDRIGILNYWVLPGSPQFVAGQPNFWDYNSTHPVAVGAANQNVDLAGLRAAMSAHEGMGLPGQLSTGHSGRLQAWINDEDSDPRRVIEGMFDPNERTLQRQVDQKLAGVSTGLFVATKDPLPVIWRGQVWFYDREDSIWRQDELAVGG